MNKINQSSYKTR